MNLPPCARCHAVICVCPAVPDSVGIRCENEAQHAELTRLRKQLDYAFGERDRIYGELKQIRTDLAERTRELQEARACPLHGPRCDIAIATRDQRIAELEEQLADSVPKGWPGLMQILDEIYPEDVFPTMPDDPARDDGPRIVSLSRRVVTLEARLAAQVATNTRLLALVSHEGQTLLDERDEAVKRALVLEGALKAYRERYPDIDNGHCAGCGAYHLHGGKAECEPECCHEMARAALASMPTAIDKAAVRVLGKERAEHLAAYRRRAATAEPAEPQAEPCACEYETAEGVNPTRVYVCPQHREPAEPTGVEE